MPGALWDQDQREAGVEPAVYAAYLCQARQLDILRSVAVVVWFRVKLLPENVLVGMVVVWLKLHTESVKDLYAPPTKLWQVLQSGVLAPFA